MHSCKQCSSAFEITEADLAFLDSISPVFAGKKEVVPPPTLCPDCRFQGRLLFRNERHLYHRKSDLTGKQIVSMYAADKPYKVYDQEEWWGDRWDGLEYGRDFDFSRTFAEQFDELNLAVPHNSLFTTNAVNSYYTNHTLNIKNSYLVFGAGNAEDCLFGRFIVNSRDVVDALSVYSCERCYEGVASQECYGCLYLKNCRGCTDCFFIDECRSCRNCIGCFGLVQKEYHIFNQPVTKEEFEAYKASLFPLTHASIDALNVKLRDLAMALPHRHAHIYGSEDCTGDFIFSSKGCRWCFDISDCEDCMYLSYSPKSVHSSDVSHTAPDGVQWCYQVGSTVGMHGGIATFLAWYGSNVMYSRECHNCHDVFGCAGLKSKQFCVFNKQYTKEEYEALVPKIIDHMRGTGEWGEYLQPASSLMGYNESIVQEVFPLTKEEVLARGWKWHDTLDPQDQYRGPAVEVPETIVEVGDDITQKILLCEVTGKPYKITPQELAFYRGLGIPLPRKCADERHFDRIAARNPRRLWSRPCSKCGQTMETTYAPERPEIIYCESCYLATTY